MIYASMMCHHRSLNELIQTNDCRTTNFKPLFKRTEYIPKMHGLRDCIIDTDYKQIENINKSVIQKAKENKVFNKNTIDGLRVMAWDGVELTETNKDIDGLPEREHKDEGIRKYIKYLCAMNVGERANIMVASKQLLEVEKVTSKSGKERAKTIGETTAFQEMYSDVEKQVGGVIDVHVFDALYLDQYVTNMINKKGKYFVIRLKEERLSIYKDAKGLFEKQTPKEEYEIVEIITEKEVKYSKKAKHKDYKKTKIKREKRSITKNKLNKKVLIEEKVSERKNSKVKIRIYEKVVVRKQVWSDLFEMEGYIGKVRVVRALETSESSNGKEKTNEIYVVTNMLNHPIETVIKIMHLRWNIDNNGFRTMKQQYNLEHIFIGNLNAINYIVQMMFLVFNLKELYMKIRLKEKVKISYLVFKKIFESEIHNTKEMWKLFEPD